MLICALVTNLALGMDTLKAAGKHGVDFANWTGAYAVIFKPIKSLWGVWFEVETHDGSAAAGQFFAPPRTGCSIRFRKKARHNRGDASVAFYPTC